MENEKRIVVTCEGNTAESMDWAQGIVLHKNALKKRKKQTIKPLSSHVQHHFVFGGMFALFLALYLFDTRSNPSSVRTAIAALNFGVVVMHIALGLTLKKALDKVRKDYCEEHAGGDIIFDSFGIEDREPSGKTVRLGWKEYEMFVITNQVMTLILGNMLFVTPYQEEVCMQLTQALEYYGKADTIIDCRSSNHKGEL